MKNLPQRRSYLFIIGAFSILTFLVLVMFSVLRSTLDPLFEFLVPFLEFILDPSPRGCCPLFFFFL
jgi:hypothetical protein